MGEIPDGQIPSGSQESDGQTEERDDSDPQFDRAYVERLRSESAGYRQTARELKRTLWQVQVRQSDMLADPSDLPMPDDADPMDPDQVTAAISDLLERKPHLAARRARGDIGQHSTGAADDPVSLLGILRQNA